MQEWVTEPGALRTILELKELRAGDEVQFYDHEWRSPSNYGSRAENPHVVRLEAHEIRTVIESYCNDELRSTHDVFSTKKGRWAIVGWRRPLKERDDGR